MKSFGDHHQLKKRKKKKADDDGKVSLCAVHSHGWTLSGPVVGRVTAASVVISITGNVSAATVVSFAFK